MKRQLILAICMLAFLSASCNKTTNVADVFVGKQSSNIP
jgi:hypothetical protein